jgi:hypothetical protein
MLFLLCQGYNFAGRSEIPAGVRFGSTNGEKDRSEYFQSHSASILMPDIAVL